ncbi:MAG: NCS2 family permease [Gemmatimonadota bacterium]|nr:MAG: NCS2 family permease [Gemmatimonadota bacterium]
MLNRLFQLELQHTAPRIEILAGLTTFLTMSYIIFVQPAVLTGVMMDSPTGMDFGAVTTATCLAAALATAVMGLYARYPIALAPGMGENFVFVATAIPVAAAAGFANPWQAALGATFVAGILFLALSLVGVREKIIDAVSSSMKNSIAVGIGLFIAFLGLRNGQLIVSDPGTFVKLNPAIMSPDVIVFLVGFVVAAVLTARRVKGAILWGILSSLLAALAMKWSLPFVPSSLAESNLVLESLLVSAFTPAHEVVSAPPSLGPTFLEMDLAAATSVAMIPVIVIFLFMDVFDTTGTLIGVGEQAGLLIDGRLVRSRQAMVSDALGTVVGAAMGTSTVTSFIESAAGVEQGGRTGLTAVTVAVLFVVALFFYPVIAMVGSYPPITAAALVLVGALMARNVTRIAWSDPTEAVPAFLTLIGIPLTNSVADGLALGLVAYPVIKGLSRRGHEVSWTMWVLAVVLVGYFVIRYS